MHDVAATFLRWTLLRALLHRGYVLTSSLYFVLEADLSASQLVLLGTVVGVTLLLGEVPAGVWADTISRKWSLVIAHVLMGAGMLMTGVVTSFPLLVATQVLWGSGWAFSSGADVAWMTDELDRPDTVARVLAAGARRELVGGATGLLAFGVLGWAVGLAAAIVASGALMTLLGVFVAARFAENAFTPTREQRSRASLSILRRGFALARADREILLMLAATMIVNGAGMVAWLFPKELVDLGFPDDPVPWYTALGILAFVVGAAALRVVQARIDAVGAARRAYALACFTGLLGLIVVASAPDAVIASVGVLLVTGVAFSVTRVVSVIWINRRTSSDVRATVHSFLSQAESIGEIVAGFALAALSQAAGASATLVAAALLLGVTGVVVARSRGDRPPTT